MNYKKIRNIVFVAGVLFGFVFMYITLQSVKEENAISEQQEQSRKDSLLNSDMELSFKDFVLGKSYKECLNKAKEEGYLDTEFNIRTKCDDYVTECLGKKCKLYVKENNDTIYEIRIEFVWKTEGDNEDVKPAYIQKYGTPARVYSGEHYWDYKDRYVILKEWTRKRYVRDVHVIYVDSSLLKRSPEYLSEELRKKNEDIQRKHQEAEEKRKISESIENDI